MIGSIIGGALSMASSLYGNYKAFEAARKAKELESENYDKQSEKNQNWYDRRYNEDSTQRADAQRMLTLTQEAMRQRNKAAAGAAAVGGGTEESVAATKAASAQAMADATSQIAAAGEKRKDAIEGQYMNRQQQLDDAHTKFGVDIENNRANNITQAASGVASAFGNMGTDIDEWREAAAAANGKTPKL